MRVKMHFGAGVREVITDPGDPQAERTFDLNAMAGHEYRKFCRLMVEAWRRSRSNG